MTFRQYLLFMGLATFLAWAGWATVLWRINPDEAGGMGIGLFFLTFFFGLAGVFATAGMSYRVLLRHRPVVLREARIAFRHAFLLASASCLLLFLARQDALRWWSAALILGGFAALETVFLHLDRFQRS